MGSGGSQQVGNSGKTKGCGKNRARSQWGSSVESVGAKGDPDANQETEVCGQREENQ